ncbi:uncharacterized protein UV8b_06119 [Ustilaginoidea virens]|uniref:Uncharacterized protein n=1 Tax=Ustilaginoidea virens TaxID=1159556 RepID=A0A8E5HV41_USTVR|nr:uncharacterized protein UV8b_06119 [Ustilaginoidea virens]QUC21878.1 hypothetical protein UV8b_06119 [Ustilaginoidea virens]
MIVHTHTRMKMCGFSFLDIYAQQKVLRLRGPQQAQAQAAVLPDVACAQTRMPPAACPLASPSNNIAYASSGPPPGLLRLISY